ncbi:hypothetical protein VNI00_007580 [Paramarasmius palmivorus]|uniref:Uncharacterized protein n=1 Tax=Paramarasmius palmivorus TaxID=297713 RepID=A0AAW0D4I2_9AGAR
MAQSQNQLKNHKPTPSGRQGNGSKKKAGDAKPTGPRGRPTWAQDGKLDILLKHGPVWADGDRKKYVDLCVKELTETFGFDVPYNCAPDPDAPPFVYKPIDQFPLEEQLAEMTKREKYKKDLRVPIGAFARNRYDKKKTDSEMIEDVLDTMSDLTKVLPTRTTNLRMFQRTFYSTLVKPTFDPYYQQLIARVPDSDWISEMNRFSNQVLQAQDQKFKDDLKVLVENDFAEKMEEYNKIGKWTNDAEKYAFNWKRSCRVVPPLADALSIHLGVGVTVLLYGPQADGEIDVQSVTSLVPDAQTKLSFVQFNRAGMVKMHKLAQDYASLLFSKDQCLSRILDEELEEDEEDREPPPGADRMLSFRNESDPSKESSQAQPAPTPTSPTTTTTTTSATTTSATTTSATTTSATTTSATTTSATTTPGPAPPASGSSSSIPEQVKATTSSDVTQLTAPPVESSPSTASLPTSLTGPSTQLAPPTVETPPSATSSLATAPPARPDVPPQPPLPDTSLLLPNAVPATPQDPNGEELKVVPGLSPFNMDYTQVPPGQFWNLLHDTLYDIGQTNGEEPNQANSLPLTQVDLNPDLPDLDIAPPASPPRPTNILLPMPSPMLGLNDAEVDAEVDADADTDPDTITKPPAKKSTSRSKARVRKNGENNPDVEAKKKAAAEKRKVTLARKKAEAAAAAASQGLGAETGKRRAGNEESEEQRSHPKRQRVMPAALAAGGYKKPAKGKRA